MYWKNAGEACVSKCDADNIFPQKSSFSLILLELVFFDVSIFAINIKNLLLTEMGSSSLNFRKW